MNNKIFKESIGKYEKAVEFLINSGFIYMEVNHEHKIYFQGSRKLLDLSINEVKNTIDKIEHIKTLQKD